MRTFQKFMFTFAFAEGMSILSEDMSIIKK